MRLQEEGEGGGVKGWFVAVLHKVDINMEGTGL
jgi:hypothetical protein